MGWAGGHTLVVDRAQGKAGGMGLGFNGGEMIALAIGGCFCNDLRYVAEAMGIQIATIEVDVSIELDGQPSIVTEATLSTHVTAADPAADVGELLRRARSISTVSNSVARGFPVKLVAR